MKTPPPYSQDVPAGHWTLEPSGYSSNPSQQPTTALPPSYFDGGYPQQQQQPQHQHYPQQQQSPGHMEMHAMAGGQQYPPQQQQHQQQQQQQQQQQGQHVITMSDGNGGVQTTTTTGTSGYVNSISPNHPMTGNAAPAYPPAYANYRGRRRNMPIMPNPVYHQIVDLPKPPTQGSPQAVLSGRETIQPIPNKAEMYYRSLAWLAIPCHLLIIASFFLMLWALLQDDLFIRYRYRSTMRTKYLPFVIPFPLLMWFYYAVLTPIFSTRYNCLCCTRRFYNRIPSRITMCMCDPLACAKFCVYKTKSRGKVFKTIRKLNDGIPMLFFAVFRYDSKRGKKLVAEKHDRAMFRTFTCHYGDLQELIDTNMSLDIYPIAIESFSNMSYTPSSENDSEFRSLARWGSYIEYRYGFELDQQDLQWIERAKDEIRAKYQTPLQSQSQSDLIDIELIYTIDGVTKKSPYDTFAMNMGNPYFYGVYLSDHVGNMDKYRISGIRPKASYDYKCGATVPYNHSTDNVVDKYNTFGEIPKPTLVRGPNPCCFVNNVLCYSLSFPLMFYPCFSPIFRCLQRTVSYNHVKHLSLARTYMIPPQNPMASTAPQHQQQQPPPGYHQAPAPAPTALAPVM